MLKLSCLQENLNKGLNIISRIASKNVNLPILNNVLLEAKEGILKLTATNLEIGIRCWVRGKIEQEGSFTVTAKLLNDYINLLPKERIDIKQEDESLKLQCNDFKSSIKGMTADDFPLIPQVDKKEKITCRVEAIKRGLNQVSFAVATDETRPEISGVFLVFSKKTLTLAATDSYRLAEKIIPLIEAAKEEREVIVPLRTLQELGRILSEGAAGENLEIYLGENQILFCFNEIELVSRIIEGQYPDYKQIIPQEHKTKIIAPTQEFMKVVRSASLFCRSGINDINLTFLAEKKEMVVTAINSQIGENVSRLAIKIEGQDNEIVFNWRYLLDGLQNIEEEEVALEIISSSSPGVLRPQNKEEYLYLIMPIKQ